MTDDAASTARRRIGFLGPEGTFTEQALLSQDDLAGDELVPMATIGEVLAATDDGSIDLGFVGIENSIEGTVNVTIDALAFEHDLLIQREVELGIQLNLMAPPGMAMADITRVLTFPVAAGQCRTWLATNLPTAEVVAANSNAEAARVIAEEHDGVSAAVAPSLAAKIYGLDVLANDIEDHPENTTRFVLVAQDQIPPATGHDKTTIVVFQRTDRPGSLLAILQEFAAPGDQPHQAREPPDEEGPRPLLLHHRPRGAPQRRARGRLPPRRPLQGRGHQVPRQLPRRRRTRPRRPPRRRARLAGRRRLDQGPEGQAVTAVTSSPERWPSGRRQRP